MKLWQRIKTTAYMAYAGATTGWKGSTWDFSNWFGRTFWGIDNSQLATNETIFSVISRLANTMSALPIKLHQHYNVIQNDVSDVLINEPNQNMSSFDFINALEVSRNETGNGYAVILRDIRMRPVELLPLDPNCVTEFINRDDSSLWYEIRGDNKNMYVHNSDMIHVKHIRGPARLRGLNPLKVLANTIKYDKAVQEFSLSEMEKKESFTLSYASNVDEEKRNRIIGDFRRFYSENGGILFKEPGVEIDPIKKQYFASDTLASERITRSRVANVFNVPVSFLNDSEGGTLGSNEQQMIQFTNMNLLPTVRQYEHEFNRKLLTKADRQAGMYFKFNLGGLLRGDTATRASFYQMGIRNGWFKQNEVRGFEDLPPDDSEYANKLWISGDLYPIDMDPTLRKSTAAASTVEGGGKGE
ncbi:phage portal protein [Lysinibacillus fusiformis]|uniref:phage portal protein n=2 Tax=Lysinibacillus TaxID=400634 RepID=UPI00087E7640|nr:phage portal protein, HK97 family [Lysinibacillus fusiformis]SDB05589.1 phage portal protein, HK97 family [Lysinibacillus fusiformis]SFH75505.1 phage portal protein, HK97 family [Lysinibacillus fusiformis]SFT29785.1 phage portal protein, HK97 family [Lysinibacillus fusiformis]